MKRAWIQVALVFVLAGCGSAAIQVETGRDGAARQKEVLERSRAFVEKLFNAEQGSAEERLSGFVHSEYLLNPNTAFRRINDLSAGSGKGVRLESAAVKEILLNGDTATVAMEVRLNGTGAQTVRDSGIWQGMLREEEGEWRVVSDRFEFQPSAANPLSGLSPNRDYSIEELARYLNLSLENGTAEERAGNRSSLSPPQAKHAASPAQGEDSGGKQKGKTPAERTDQKERYSGSPVQRRQAIPTVSEGKESAPEGGKPQSLSPAETGLVVLYKNVPVPLSTSSALVRAIGYPDRLYFDEEKQSLILEYPGLKAAVKGQVLASLEITASAGGAQLQDGIKVGSKAGELAAKYGQPQEEQDSHSLYAFKNAELVSELSGDTIVRLRVVPRNLAAPDPRDAFLRISNASQSDVYNRIYRNACAACHGVYLEGGKGPALNHIGSRLTLDELSRVIAEGKGEMPPAGLEQGELDALALWLYLQK